MTTTTPTPEEIAEGIAHLEREVLLAARQWLRTGDTRQLRISTEALEKYEERWVERLG